MSRTPSSKLFTLTGDDSLTVSLLAKTAITDNDDHFPTSPQVDPTVAGILRERAFLLALAGKEIGIPTVYPIVVPPSPEPPSLASCLIATTVFSNEGDDSLVKMAAIPHTTFLSHIEVAQVIQRIITMVWRLHAAGVVHGDIHLGNFVYSDKDSAIAESVRMIDFDRAFFYIDESGAHIPDTTQIVSDSITIALLSPWEIEGGTKSRRDDLFRIAEMAIHLVTFDTAFTKRVATIFAVTLNDDDDDQLVMPNTYDSRAALAKAKRGRTFTESVPQVFQALYKYALGLDFAAEPDYVRCIEALR